MQFCDLISSLKCIRALDGLVDHEYAWIAENGVHKHANAGEVIFREGDPATVMFFVLSGEVRRSQPVGATPSDMNLFSGGGVYGTRKTGQALHGAEDRDVAPLEGGRVVA